MSRLDELKNLFEITQNQLVSLQKEYEGKLKGNAYITRYTQLVNKMDHYKDQFIKLGTKYNIIHISAVRYRLGKKNKQIKVQEKFDLYWTDIIPTDAHRLFNSLHKNIITYELREIKPGITIIK